MSRDMIQPLCDEVTRLRGELQQAETNLADALMSACRFKAGDRVRVTTPQARHQFRGGKGENSLDIIASEVLPDKVEQGRVEKVWVEMGHREDPGHLRIKIVGDTKDGRPGKREMRIAGDANIEKIDA